jgi:hypothetical protein
MSGENSRPVICKLKVQPPTVADSDGGDPLPYNDTDVYDECKDGIYPLVADTAGSGARAAMSRLMTHNSGWPEKTGALCHWCCHGFEGMPFGIPVARRAGKFHVIGNFCSLECAAASNFDRNRGSDLAWERNMLINELSAAVGNGLEKVTPAPARELLLQFGGDMDIAKFRGMVRRVRLIYPPCMVVEPQHVEEVDAHQVLHGAQYVPIDDTKLDKYRDVRLKRSKPRKGSMLSLDAMLMAKSPAACAKR